MTLVIYESCKMVRVSVGGFEVTFTNLNLWLFSPYVHQAACLFRVTEKTLNK